jgi:hypothetical protein
MVCSFLTQFSMCVEIVMNVNECNSSKCCLFVLSWVMPAFTDLVSASAECGTT